MCTPPRPSEMYQLASLWQRSSVSYGEKFIEPTQYYSPVLGAGGRPDNLFGRIGRCSKGRLGYITGYKKMPWGDWSYTGKQLDDGTLWASRYPVILGLIHGWAWAVWYTLRDAILK